MKTKIKKHPLIYDILLIGVVVTLAIYSLNFDWINSKLQNKSPNQKSSDEQKIGIENYERQKDTDTWTLYQNKLIGYEIKFPSNWNISEESFAPNGNKATEQSNLIDIYPGGMEKDFLMKITIEGLVDVLALDEKISPDVVWKDILSNFKSWDLEEKTITETNLNGTNYTLITGFSTESGVFRSKTYVTRINNGKGTLAIIIRDKSDQASELFDQIVETLTLQ
jgi:hypothetical protein